MNNPGTVILSVADLRRMKVEADVDETDVASIRLGQTASVKVDALPDTTLTDGSLNRQFAQGVGAGDAGAADQLRRDVMIDQPPPILRPGMTADVEIKTATKRGILHVPIRPS